jgi:N utilization substance protein B
VGTALSNRVRMLTPPLSSHTSRFVQQLCQGVTHMRPQLDQVIGQFAPEWPVDQIAAIDRNILRMALWEMNFVNTPTKVVINEAVELAKEFGSDTSPRFVNGVLGAAIRNQKDMLALLQDSPQSTSES